MNTEELKALPRASFKNPPLVEVAASVQFEHPLGINTLDMANIWSSFDRKRFSRYREMPPLDPLLPQNTHLIEMSPLPPMRRYWFETEQQDALIQLQQDRLIYNWKRPPSNFNDQNCYPRYEKVIAAFFEYYGKLIKFLEDRQLQSSNPSYLGLTYINLIEIPENGLGVIGKVFKDINLMGKERLLPAPQNIHHTWFFQVPDLPISLKTDLSTRQRVHDGSKTLQYELSVTGPISDFSYAGMQDWFKNAHLWITHGFVDATSNEMHKEWEKQIC